MCTLATDLAGLLKALPPECIIERSSSEALLHAAQLQLDREVVEVSADLKSTPRDLLAAIEARALRLPYNPLWMEWPGVHSVELAPAKSRLVPMDAPGSPTDRVGVLVQESDAGKWTITVGVRRRDGACDWLPAAVLLQGLQLRIITNPFMAVLDTLNALCDGPGLEDICQIARHGAIGALHIIALLTARNAPLTILDHADDYVRLNRQRAKRGKPPVLGCRPVRWNLSREIRRNGGQPLGEADRKRAVAHIVRGHLKIRRSGPFWWRPHFRNVEPGDKPPPGRDYRVTP